MRTITFTYFLQSLWAVTIRLLLFTRQLLYLWATEAYSVNSVFSAIPESNVFIVHQCKHQTHIHSDCFQSVLTLSIISHEHNHVNMRSFLSACRTDVIMHSWTYGLSRMAGESNPVSCYAHRISSAAVHRSHRHPFNYQTTICYQFVPMHALNHS